jgi:mono/diheme cytochrome c family protein
MRNVPATCFVLFLLASPCSAGETVDYTREIKPIFRERCYACHGALKQESGLRVDTAAALLKGGDNGPAIIASKADQSLLLKRVSATDDGERMPPEGKPLTPEQIARLAAWIAGGAPAPPDEQSEADPRQHWAFQRPQRPVNVDMPGAGWPRNRVDAILAA